MNAALFNEAIESIAEKKGVSSLAVLEALKEALSRAYVKSVLRSGDDARVYVNIDADEGYIDIAQLKKVVPEVEDDYLEISLEDAKADAENALARLNEDLKSLKGEKAAVRAEKEREILHQIELVKKAQKEIRYNADYPLYCSLEDLSKAFAKAVDNIFHARLVDAERVALYDIYKDHIGEMVTGTVEKADERSLIVDIGRTKVELTRREMIGDEMFKIGDPIKVYIQEVKQANNENRTRTRGPQIEVTRSSEGFLKRLFEEEIHEIYDGTVIIKSIAREAGVRSKVAVYSTNDDVDPTGACIGPAGSRIQKVVAQLGNGSKEKEKIDIVAYSDYTPLYLAESLRPATCLGVDIEDEENKEAVIVVKDDVLSVAIGRKGANARLASKLTGWNLEVISESEAQEKAIDYVPLEELKKEAVVLKAKQEMAIYAEKNRQEFERKKQESEEKLEMVQPLVHEEKTEEKEETIVQEVPSINEPTAPVVPEINVEIKAQEAVTPSSDEKPLEVKTTTTLEDLEKELAKSKGKDSHRNKKDSKKRPHHISDEEVARVKPSEIPLQNAMPIYSEEELAEIEKEESELEEEEGFDDLDFDDYDRYYDEGN